MKRILALVLTLALAVSMLAGCGAKTDAGTDTTDTTNQTDNAADTNNEGNDTAEATFDEDITVLSREDGSGTRGAFIELTGVEQKDSDGNKVDHTVDTAEITNSTSVMMATAAGNKAAIGYISLGSLNDTVKALKVDGVEATAENVKNGTYTLSRPFNIATNGNVSEVAQDFLSFIMSDEGQKVCEDNNCISQGSTGAYAGNKPSGSITVAGSSSVTPVMEKLKEAYLAVNPNASIEIQQSDSTTGMNSVKEGICDIGMASRELKDSEKEAGLVATVIALDGIAVIVNNENPTENITTEQIMKIYTGEITSWADVK
jgi:phosphate transport system substrate-binding protein